jgi:acyl dehydratase
MMTLKNRAQVYFEEVEAGLKLPSIAKDITLPQMAMYAAVCWDFMPIHYDSGTAQSFGFRAAFADGPMETAFLCQVVTDWLGMQGVLKKINASYRGMVFPGDRLTCKGEVRRKYKEGEENLVEVEVWADNQEGQKVVYGTAVATLPSCI